MSSARSSMPMRTARESGSVELCTGIHTINLPRYLREGAPWIVDSSKPVKACAIRRTLRNQSSSPPLVNATGNRFIVPPGREMLFGKGLVFGYEGDFPSALHLLVPQLENMVRYHPKAAGARDRIRGNGVSAL